MRAPIRHYLTYPLARLAMMVWYRWLAPRSTAPVVIPEVPQPWEDAQ